MTEQNLDTTKVDQLLEHASQKLIEDLLMLAEGQNYVEVDGERFQQETNANLPQFVSGSQVIRIPQNSPRLPNKGAKRQFDLE